MKSGSLYFILVLLAVFAVSLPADQPLGNTVGNFSATSTTDREELPESASRPIYGENIGIPPKPIPIMWLPVYCFSVDYGGGRDGTIMIKRIEKSIGGARRIKSGRH